MPVDDLEAARSALRDGKLTNLLGVPECGWLDVKSGIYPLDDPAGVEELVKDVAGFANTRTGSLLLVGFSTRKEHDREPRQRYLRRIGAAALEAYLSLQAASAPAAPARRHGRA